jgi:F-type H+-transporting ATPase subunit delta
MSLQSVIDIYAQSIFNVACREKKINRWKKVLKLLSWISQNKKVKIIFSSYLDSIELYHFFKFLFKNLKIRKSEKNLLKILSENKRLILLSKIYKAYKFKKNNYENVIEVVLKTSYVINQVKKKEIIDLLNNYFSKKISLKCFVDKTLIDGMIIFVNGFVIDYSIKHDLNNLENFLKI